MKCNDSVCWIKMKHNMQIKHHILFFCSTLDCMNNMSVQFSKFSVNNLFPLCILQTFQSGTWGALSLACWLQFTLDCWSSPTYLQLNVFNTSFPKCRAVSKRNLPGFQLDQFDLKRNLLGRNMNIHPPKLTF